MRLARCRSRDLIEKDDAGRALVGRQALGAVGQDLVCRRALAMGHDEGHATLAPFRIRQPEHGHIPDLGMGADDGFDLGREDVFSAGDIHVLQAVRDMDHAAFRAAPEIAGAIPFADKGAGRLARLVPVTGGDRGALDPDLADVTVSDILAIVAN